jgi:hypothetical protein
VEKGLTVVVIDQHGMLTPPWHLIPPLIYSEVRVRPFSDLRFPIGLMRLNTVRYFCHFIEDIYKDSKNSQISKHVKEDQTHHSRNERLLPVGHDRHLAQHQPGKSTSVST